MVSEDYEDLFKILNTYKIKYLVVGAHAVMFYSEPRFTKDMDVWIPGSLNDPKRVHKALNTFVPLKGLKPSDFQDPKLILQIGVAPVRVDILGSVSGVSAEEAWRHRRRNRYGRTSIHILGLKELIRTKKATGRPQDRLDLAHLCKKVKKKV